MKISNSWRVQSFLTILQNAKDFQVVRLSNGENFNLTENSTLQEMYSAQTRCITTAIYMMK